MKSHMKSHGRIALFHGRSVHPDAMEAYNALTRSQEEALVAVVETATTVEEYLHIQRENDDDIHDEFDETDS